MTIVHISDTHGQHEALTIPKCEVLIHTGDIGGRTNLKDLVLFLNWFDRQPALKKIFIAGNHDIIFDKLFSKHTPGNPWEELYGIQRYDDAIALITAYGIEYLQDSAYTYNGVKFYGSPYSPSFHRTEWAFNADRGEEIKKVWAKIPDDTDILLTHTPPHEILDYVPDNMVKCEMKNNVGCFDLEMLFIFGLPKLRLHCFGHIHANYGTLLWPESGLLFSNGAVLDHEYKLVVPQPIVITINL